MTQARYCVRRDRDFDENPLTAALPLKDEWRRQFMSSKSCRMPSQQPSTANPTPSDADGRTTLRFDLQAEDAVALLDAVHHSLLEAYRRRNPLDAPATGVTAVEFDSPPTTLLTWEMGGDRQALALFERVTEQVPTVIDHELFKGREFRFKQLVCMTIEVNSIDVVASACRQILGATDATYGTSMASRLTRSATRMSMAISASYACQFAQLGLLCLHVPLPLPPRDARALWELLTFLQMRCGMALLLCCSDQSARRMATDSPHGRRLIGAKLFGVTRCRSAGRGGDG